MHRLLWLSFRAILAVGGLLAVHTGHATEMEERVALRAEARTAYTGGDFEALDRMSIAYVNPAARTSSGLWKLTLFHEGVSAVLSVNRQDDTFWDGCEKFLAYWIHKHPDSTFGHLAYGQMLLNRGWSHLRVDTLPSAFAEQLKRFADDTALARHYLEEHKAVASRSPYWYELMEKIALRQRWSEAAFSQLSEEGFARYPNFYPLYFEAVDYYAVGREGSAAAIERVAMEAVRRTKATDGDGLYARVYWAASQSVYGNSLFSKSQVRWDVMKRSIDDVLKSYPDGWNFNNFARFACLAGDKPKTAELLARVKPPFLAQAWDNEDYFRRCGEWAARPG